MLKIIYEMKTCSPNLYQRYRLKASKGVKIRDSLNIIYDVAKISFRRSAAYEAEKASGFTLGGKPHIPLI